MLSFAEYALLIRVAQGVKAWTQVFGAVCCGRARRNVGLAQML